MHKLFIILFGMFPALTGATLAVLISKPDGRLTAIITLPVWILGTILTQILGMHLQTRDSWTQFTQIINASRIAGLILGVMVFCLVLFLIESDAK